MIESKKKINSIKFQKLIYFNDFFEVNQNNHQEGIKEGIVYEIWLEKLVEYEKIFEVKIEF